MNRWSLPVAAVATVFAASLALADGVLSRRLPAGEWLVTVEQYDDCSTGELSLAKSYRYDDALALAEVTVEATGLVPDNLVRPAVCVPGTSVGTILVAVETPVTLTAASTDQSLTIARAEKVQRATTLRLAGASVELPAGRYAVAVEGFDGCNGNAEINVAKTYTFAFETDALALTEITLADAGIVRDNLIRLAVCRPGPLTGEIALELAAPARVRVDADLQIKGVRKLSL